MDRELMRVKGVYDYEALVVVESQLSQTSMSLMDADKKLQAGELLTEEELDVLSEAIKILLNAKIKAKRKIREARTRLFQSEN